MEMLGDPEYLRKEIEKRYQQKIAKVVHEGEREIAELKRQSEKKMQGLASESDQRVARDARIAHDTAFNELMTDAKREYEVFCEERYEEIFSDILENAKGICSQKDFISWVASFAGPFGKGAVIRCLPAAAKALSKATKAKVVADKKIAGAFLEADGAAYDLTIPTLLDTKKDLLRRIISDLLRRQN